MEGIFVDPQAVGGGKCTRIEGDIKIMLTDCFLRLFGSYLKNDNLKVDFARLCNLQ